MVAQRQGRYLISARHPTTKRVINVPRYRCCNNGPAGAATTLRPSRRWAAATRIILRVNDTVLGTVTCTYPKWTPTGNIVDFCLSGGPLTDWASTGGCFASRGSCTLWCLLAGYGPCMAWVGNGTVASSYPTGGNCGNPNGTAIECGIQQSVTCIASPDSVLRRATPAIAQDLLTSPLYVNASCTKAPGISYAAVCTNLQWITGGTLDECWLPYPGTPLCDNSSALLCSALGLGAPLNRTLAPADSPTTYADNATCPGNCTQVMSIECRDSFAALTPTKTFTAPRSVSQSDSSTVTRSPSETPSHTTSPELLSGTMTLQSHTSSATATRTPIITPTVTESLLDTHTASRSTTPSASLTEAPLPTPSPRLSVTSTLSSTEAAVNCSGTSALQTEVATPCDSGCTEQALLAAFLQELLLLAVATPQHCGFVNVTGLNETAASWLRITGVTGCSALSNTSLGTEDQIVSVTIALPALFPALAQISSVQHTAGRCPMSIHIAPAAPYVAVPAATSSAAAWLVPLLIILLLCCCCVGRALWVRRLRQASKASNEDPMDGVPRSLRWLPGAQHIFAPRRNNVRFDTTGGTDEDLLRMRREELMMMQDMTPLQDQFPGGASVGTAFAPVASVATADDDLL